MSHSADVPTASLPRSVEVPGADGMFLTGRALQELLWRYFQSNSKVWSSLTFLELGGMNDISLIIAFGVTSLSMKLKNKV